MTIAAILTAKGGAVTVVSPDMKVADVVATLAQARIGAAPVVDGDGRPIGIVSERDILIRLAADGAAMLALRADQVMTAPARTVTADTGVVAALLTMTRRRIRHLPVVDGAGAMIGIVSIGDLVKARVEAAEREAALLRDYISGA